MQNQTILQDTIPIKILWWSHLLVVLGLYALFFIPTLIVPLIATVHLYYMLWIALTQAFWGIMMRKFRGNVALVCPMTTLMQHLRGYPPSDFRNHSHSFVVEVMEHFDIKWKFSTINYMMLVTIVLVVVRFIIVKYI